MCEPNICDQCGAAYHQSECPRCSFEYNQGVAEANAYMDSVLFLGEEEANRLAVEDEIRRGGEW